MTRQVTPKQTAINLPRMVKKLGRDYGCRYGWALGGSYLISTYRGAKTLDAALRDEIKRLTTPSRTPAQEHCYQEAKAALDEIGPTAKNRAPWVGTLCA